MVDEVRYPTRIAPAGSCGAEPGTQSPNARLPASPTSTELMRELYQSLDQTRACSKTIRLNTWVPYAQRRA